MARVCARRPVTQSLTTPFIHSNTDTPPSPTHSLQRLPSLLSTASRHWSAYRHRAPPSIRPHTARAQFHEAMASAHSTTAIAAPARRISRARVQVMIDGEGCEEFGRPASRVRRPTPRPPMVQNSGLAGGIRTSHRRRASKTRRRRRDRRSVCTVAERWGLSVKDAGDICDAVEAAQGEPTPATELNESEEMSAEDEAIVDDCTSRPVPDDVEVASRTSTSSRGSQISWGPSDCSGSDRPQPPLPHAGVVFNLVSV